MASSFPFISTSRTLASVRRQITAVDKSNPLTVGLTNAYPLSGTTVDLVGGANCDAGSASTFNDSARGLVASFNGSSDYLRIPSSVGVPTLGSWSLWFFTTGTGLYQVFGKSYGGDGSTTRIELSSGQAFFRTYTYGGTYPDAVVPVYSTNGWHHVVATWGSSFGIQLYFDGVYVDGDPSTASNNTAANIYFGVNWNEGYSPVWYYPGLLSDVLLYNRRVQANEVQELYRNPNQIYVGYPRKNRTACFLPTAAGGTDTTLTPSAGSLTLTGFATTVGQSYERTPSVGTLTFTGYAASVAVGGDRTLTPGAGSLTLFGFAPFPTVDNNTYLTTGLGSLTLTGYAPTVTTPLNLIPGVGSVTLTGYAPTIGQTYSLTPGVGSAAFTGYAPTIGVGYSLQTGLGALTLTGYAPTLGRTYSMTPAVGALTLTGLQPTVTATGQSIWTNISASSTIWTNQSASSTTWTNLN